MAPKSLMCVVLGDGYPFVIDIDDNKRVANLKDMIKEKKSSLIECEARRLTLYAANKDKNWKESGGDWLEGKDPSVELLKQDASIPAQIKDIMDKEREMNPTESIDDLFKNAPTKGVIHVLVQLPEDERQRSANCQIVPGIGTRVPYDNIDTTMPYLKRETLLSSLIKLVREQRVVLLASPAGSGKTSLLTLYCTKVQHEVDIIWIDCRYGEPMNRQLQRKGIDMVAETLDHNVGNRFTVVLLDDAQSQYEDKAFWTDLIKHSHRWMKREIRFIISATHLLAGGVASPVEFILLSKLKREEFLLSESEARELLTLPVIGLPAEMQFESLMQFLISECGGLVGALRMAIDFLDCHFRKETRGKKPSESLLLQLCLSRDFTLGMARCFGTGRLNPKMDDNDIKFLKRCFDEKFVPGGCLTNEEEISRQWLEMAGILVTYPDTFICFSSPIAKRYMFEKSFPERSRKNPESLDELIENVIASMSAHTLSQSTVNGKFPKEAVFQHLFMARLALHTKPTCAICPELSQRFPGGLNASGDENIDGEIDFYLDDDLRWGIELLVCGRGIGEHLSRFDVINGKYSPLQVNDYVVVDLRLHKTVAPYKISKSPNRITIFFEDGDFTVAQCLFRLENEMRTIRLC